MRSGRANLQVVNLNTQAEPCGNGHLGSEGDVPLSARCRVHQE